MQKQIIFGSVGLIVGLAIGFFAANSFNRNTVSPKNIAQTASGAPFLNQQNANQSTIEHAAKSEMQPAVMQTLEKANSDPENFEAQIAAGEMYLRIKNFDKALEFYQKANQIRPSDYETIVKIGNAYFDSEKFEEAEKWYSKALAVKPEDTNVRTDLGITFVERETPDFERGVKEFQTSLKTNPKHEPTLFNLAVAYYKKGDAERAKETLEQLETVNPQSNLAKRLRQLFAAK